MQKKQKLKRKVEKMAKEGNAVMSQHNYSIVATKSQGNLQKFVVVSKTMLQQRQSRVQDDNRKICRDRARTMLQQRQSRVQDDNRKICCDISQLCRDII